MSALLEEHNLDNALNDFIDGNIGDKLFLDLENPSCRLVTPVASQDSPTSDKSLKAANLLDNIKAALKDGSNFAKTVGTQPKFATLSSRSSVEGNVPNKNEILEHAEAVIEYQRERINILEKTLEKFNVAMTKTTEMHKDELDKFEKENRDMRLQMQNVVSDYDAISKRYKVDMGEFEALKGKSLQTDSELLKKDQQIREMERKLELLPKENEMLKMQKRELQEEVKALKSELFPQARSWQRKTDELGHNVPGVLPNALARSSASLMPHVLCDVRKHETASMGRCLMQVENDLTSYKRLTEEQRSEIQRLNNLLLAKKKTEELDVNPYFGSHKQLMYLRDVFVSMVKATNELKESLKVKKEEPVETEDRSLHAAYMLKSNSEQREMYDKLLDVVKNMISVKSSSTSFYRSKVDYCKLTELNEFDLDLKYHKMLAEVDDAVLLVHKLEDEQIVHTEKITQEGLKAVRSDFKNLQFILKDTHFHVFKLDNADAYNRLYYSLQYAGFVMDDSKPSIYSKVDLTHLNSEETWPHDLVPVLFSKVVSYSELAGQRSPTNAVNRPNAFMAQQFNLNLVTVPDPMGNVANQFQPNYELLINNLFDNANVLSEFTTSLVYYDQNSKSLVVYGPNLANKPKVLKPENTYKFTVTNNLEYAGNEKGVRYEGNDKYIESYQVPFATFPNGEPVLDHFNPQLTNYSLVSVKFNQPPVELNAPVVDDPLHPPVQSLPTNQLGGVSPTNLAITQFNQNVANWDLELDLYYVLPLNPRYNEPLTRLMNNLEFMKLKATQTVTQDMSLDIPDEDKFYTFLDGCIQLVLGMDAEPITLHCSKSFYMINEQSSAVTLMSDIETENMESYSFQVTNSALLKKFIEELEAHGIKSIGGLTRERSGHFCVVTRGLLRIFADKPTGPQLSVEFKPESTKVEVNEKIRQIVLSNLIGREQIDMELNCMRPGVLEKWMFALKFGGFIKHDKKEDKEMTKLTHFMFDIVIYSGKGQDGPLEVTSNKIALYTDPGHNQMYQVWHKENVNLELDPEKRMLRIYIKKHTKFEERYDLVLRRVEDYMNMTSMLQKFNYKIDEKKQNYRLRHHFVFSKEGIISLHRTKYELEPLIQVRTCSYTAELKSEALTIKFAPKDKTKTPIKLSLKNVPTYKKFLYALKVANFIPMTKERMLKDFFPKFSYAFGCPEAKQIFKDCLV